jgi:hypothetical protein
MTPEKPLEPKPSSSPAEPPSSQLPALRQLPSCDVRQEYETEVVGRVVRDCGFCLGKGRYPMRFADCTLHFKCKACSGTGKVEIHVEQGQVLLQCPYCRGSGSELPCEDRMCRACGGVGYMVFDSARHPMFQGRIPRVWAWGDPPPELPGGRRRTKPKGRPRRRRRSGRSRHPW